jgi:hypothetical protein
MCERRREAHPPTRSATLLATAVVGQGDGRARLEESRYDEAQLAGLNNVAAALSRLENSREPHDMERVLGSLVQWLAAEEQTALRRAFVVWLKRVLLPARVPGAEIPNVVELQEMRAMLAERVKTWTEQWKQRGLQQGLERVT